jgi:hypothetical protein
MIFKKIDHFIETPIFEIGEKSHEFLVPNSSVSLCYYDLKFLNSEFVNSVCSFFKNVSFDVLYATITGNGSSLFPHRDHGITNAFNYYLTTNSEITQFWKPKQNAIPFSYEKGMPKNIYFYEDLNLVDEFVAYPNDCYFLNVSEIHSVKQLNHEMNRSFISFQW